MKRMIVAALLIASSFPYVAYGESAAGDLAVSTAGAAIGGSVGAAFGGREGASVFAVVFGVFTSIWPAGASEMKEDPIKSFRKSQHYESLVSKYGKSKVEHFIADVEAGMKQDKLAERNPAVTAAFVKELSSQALIAGINNGVTPTASSARAN